VRARLTPTESDIVVRTARIMARATDVLGDKKKAVHWLTRPNKSLGEVPISLLDTSAGEHEVEALLDRIEYGVYS
jgi:putative toxin-antitoxin system antitoxin component (TIGR02293 family)